MERIYAVEGSRVRLGRRDENLARCILFDISRWEALYGEGTVQLIHQRCGDEYPYPCAITVEDGKVEWEIGVADVALVGVGRAELQYFVGEQLAKSVVYATETMQALDTTAPIPPDPPEAGWVAQVLAAGTQASVSAKEARESEEAARSCAAEARESAEASRENEEHTAQMKQDAEAAAAEASGSADDAHSAAGTAQSQARISAQSAQQARRYADSAAGSARQAEQAERNAHLASDSASDASASATSANQAKQAAESARDAAQAAQEGAEQAQRSAAIANGQAQNAAAMAEEYSQRAALSESNAADSADRAEAAVAHPPYVGDNGNWYEWDEEAGAFVDSGVGARGPQGETGVTTPVNGFFTLAVDGNGDLWAYSDEDLALDFEYDEQSGNLYVVQEV